MINNVFKADTLTTEIGSKPEHPFYIKEIKSEHFDWGLFITTIIAIVSTAIVVYDRIKKTKISGKILSISFTPNFTFTGKQLDKTPFQLKGQQYFLKFSFQVTQKSLFYNDVKVNVRYKNDPNIYKAEIFWSDTISGNFEDGRIFDLRIPENDFLWFNNLLPVDRVTFQYLLIIVETDRLDICEEVQLTFINEKGKSKKMKPFKISDIDCRKMLFDREIIIERK
jgi:hypothetical protein